MTITELMHTTNRLDYISTDYENGHIMVRSDLSLVDFDKVKEHYSKEFGGYCPKSCDGLYYEKRTGTYYLIEFKNGKISNEVKTQVYFKVLESLSILSDIMNKPSSFFREHCSFILVFNDNKNRASIGSHIMQNAGGEIIRFGIDRFERIFLKSVYTLNSRDFYVRFAKKWERAK